MTKKTFLQRQDELGEEIIEYVNICREYLLDRVYGRHLVTWPNQKWVSHVNHSESLLLWVDYADNYDGDTTYTRPKVHKNALFTLIQLNCRERTQDYWRVPKSWHHIVNLDISSKDTIDSYFNELHVEIDAAIQETKNHDHN